MSWLRLFFWAYAAMVVIILALAWLNPTGPPPWRGARDYLDERWTCRPLAGMDNCR